MRDSCHKDLSVVEINYNFLAQKKGIINESQY